MIISRTPFRISLFGGGTDYPVWYRKHGGRVLSTSIDKYCYITCRYLPPFFEHRIRVMYSKIEMVQTLDEIQHPAVREVLRYLQIDRGVEIHHDGDLPARSGMGSSSSFTVGLLHALYALQGRMPTRTQLASESTFIEQEILRETVGSQDQIAAAHGGFNKISFLPNDQIHVRPITVAPERVRQLNDHLMLFYTGIKRTASDVAQGYVSNLDRKQAQLKRAGELVDLAIDILAGDEDLRQLGPLLHEAWCAKRGLSPRISPPEVDHLYQTARDAGAMGGKLTGAGAGGFMLLFVPPEKQDAVKAALSHLIHVPFRFEYGGSQIIFHDVEEDYSAVETARGAGPVRAFREHTAEEG